MKVNKCLGIYLSDRAFSISHLITKGSKYEVDLVHWEKVDLNPKEPEDVKFAYFAKRIKEVLKQNKIRTKNAVFSISGMSVFNRKRKLPNVPSRKLKGIVRYEASQVIPFPYDQIYLQYCPYRNPEESNIDVWIMAAKRDLVDNFLRKIKKTGLRINKLEVTSVSLFNLAQMDNLESLDEEETFGVAYFGHSSVDISVGDKNQLGFTRSSPFAGNEIAKSLSKKQEVNYLEAENIRDSKIVALLEDVQEEDMPEGYDYKASQDARPIMERMVADVRRSIDFYISQPDGVAVERLFICGPLCQIPFFREFVEENLGLPVELKKDLNENLFVVKKDEAASHINTGYGSLALAFDGVHEPPTLIDFLPPEMKDFRSLRENKGKVAVCAALVAINVAIAGTLGTVEVSKIRSAVSRMQESIAEGQEVANRYEEALNTQESLNRYLQYLASFKKGEDVLEHSDFPLLLLQVVNENIPLDTVWLDSFRFTEDRRAFLVAKTVDLSHFWVVYDQVDNHPMLDVSILSRRDEEDPALDRRIERFSLEIRLAEEEEEEE